MRRRAGFTLIEMIVATVLLAVGVAGCLGALSAAVRAEDAATRRNTASLLAAQQLSSLESQPSTLAGGDSSGHFSDPYSEYSWHQSIETTELQSIFKVTLNVIWTRGTRQQSYTLVTYLSNGSNPTASSTSGGPGSSTLQGLGGR